MLTYKSFSKVSDMQPEDAASISRASRFLPFRLHRYTPQALAAVTIIPIKIMHRIKAVLSLESGDESWWTGAKSVGAGGRVDAIVIGLIMVRAMYDEVG